MPTKIQWCDETLNIIGGCSHAGSKGCDNCFAARMAATRLKNHPLYKGLTKWVNGQPQWTGELRVDLDRLEQLLKWKKTRRIFVCSMSDLFHENVMDDQIQEIWQLCRNSHHTYLWLTKRIDRALKWANLTERTWTPNIHIGVSICTQAEADEKIPILLQIPAAVHYISYEPALEYVDFTRLNLGNGVMYDALSGIILEPGSETSGDGINKLNGLIAGCESINGKLGRPAKIDWFRSARDQCLEAGVPFLLKQTSGYINGRCIVVPMPYLDGRQWAQLPEAR